jgi:hypothetical protein
VGALQIVPHLWQRLDWYFFGDFLQILDHVTDKSADILKKLCLFDTKENTQAGFTTCLGHGKESCQQALLMFFGEHALSPLHTEVAFDANNLAMSYSNIEVDFFDHDIVWRYRRWIPGGISDIVIQYKRWNIDIEDGISDIV